MRKLSIVLVALTGCAATASDEIEPYYESSKADGDARQLRQVDRDHTEVEEPSDLAFAGGKLYTVSDRHSKIYEIGRGGKIKDTIDVEASDLEAIAVDPRTGELVIADENRATIWFIDAAGSATASIALDAASNNSGIEGLAFDDAGHLFVAQEKDPARIYTLDAKDGHELARKKIAFADDLSALAWNPEDGHLYALSDQERTLYRLDRDLDKTAAWRLPMDQPEGLAFEGTTLYIVSDSEARIYEFTLE